MSPQFNSRCVSVGGGVDSDTTARNIRNGVQIGTVTGNFDGTWWITGTVTLGGVALASVTITGSAGLSGTATTDAAGYFEFKSVATGSTGVLTPTKTGYTFTPTTINISSVTGDQSGKDYAGDVDVTAPSPDPMTFATPPTANGSSQIDMVATTATDTHGVEYYFECTAGAGGHSSSWQASASYSDTGLTAETQYTYRVRARDQSYNANTTAYSATANATTAAASFTDDFNRANGAVGNNWTDTSSWSISSNQLLKTPAGWQVIQHAVPGDPTNHYAQVTRVDGGQGGVTVRFAGSYVNGSSGSGYWSQMGTYYNIGKITNGNDSILATSSTVPQNGDVVKLTAVGSTLTLYVNEAQILQTTDATHSGVSVGVSVYDGDKRFDNFSCGAAS